MRQSNFFTPTLKEAPKDEAAGNAKLLIRAGFIDKLMAGVYTFLPLGLMVLRKIERIAREEMDRIEAREMLMPSLHPQENWRRTGRWDGFDALFKIESKAKSQYALGPTHEEVIYPLIAKKIYSYKDLPLALYQIQNKFRDEPRAKSGLLRTREFLMKDLYSFHTDEKDRDRYYEKAKKAYQNIFKRIGLNAIAVEASGGTFSEISLEFQTPSAVGEDIILICGKCGFAQNKEVAKSISRCPKCAGDFKEENAVEVGNIFPLKRKFAEDFEVFFLDRNGDKKLVSAGCYGFGVSRAMGAIVETSHDERGIIWPESVAPFKVHLMAIAKDKKIKSEAEKFYAKLSDSGVEVLYDDRDDKTAGEKFAEADLIGIPYRVVVSGKTVKAKKIEVKERRNKDAKLAAFNEFLKKII